VIVLAAWEWSRLAGLHSTASRAVYVVGTLALLWGAYYLSPYVVLLVALGWWLVALVWITGFGDPKMTWPPWLRAIAGVVVLVPAWWALVALHGVSPSGRYYLLFLLVLVWVADSAAYFSGRLWGTNKLAPRISPGKTWEGVWGALIAGLVLGVLGVILFGVQGSRWVAFVALCAATVAFSILGDLAESAFKRQSGLKDSGQLLPGHGGILDRVDSLTAAAPVFMLGLWSLELTG
jgi:phosphatidate cytidylyltransferase